MKNLRRYRPVAHAALAVATATSIGSTASARDIEGNMQSLVTVETGILFPIQDAPKEPADFSGGVMISRAADLVGTPISLIRAPRAPAIGTRAAATGSGSLALAPFAMPTGMPVAARALTSGFGYRQHPVLGGRRAHLGLDLAAPAGSPIVATSSGVVSADGWAGGYGLLVTLDHGGGVQTRYGHMSRLNVVSGQRVRKGDVIGYVGSTGMSTGPHLHYEVRVGGQPVDPLRTLQGR